MTLQSSGPISLGDIQGEFGGATPLSLSNYFRGGPNVPDHGNTTPIPTSGIIALTDFYGTSVDPPLPTITAGVSGNNAGFSRGIYGSVSPDGPWLSGWILAQCSTNSGDSVFRLGVTPINTPDTNASWRELRLTGTFSGGTGTQIYLRANRNSYLGSTAGKTLWQFTQDGLGNMVNGSPYTVDFRL